MQPNPYASLLFTDFRVRVNANGKVIVYTGDGEGDAAAGRVNVSVKTEDEIPQGFQTGAMSFVLITGQADISQNEGVENPFRVSLGAYQAHRSLDLGQYGRLECDYVVGPPKDDRRQATFEISGQVNLPQLVSIEPTKETWTPVSETEYRGRFEMVWNTANGERVTGITETTYKFPVAVPMQHLARTIEFELRAEEKSMFQSENIRLFAARVASK